MKTVEMRGKIRWADADAARRLHFPRMFEYFEDGESELLRSVGYGLQEDGRAYDFPRVHVECEFKKVLALNAPFFMRVSVGKLGRRSIRYEYQVFADEDMTELAVAGSMTVVAVQNGKSVDLPESLRAALTRAD
ncbi:MAG: thioesterase family protein [Acidobacteriota bacterium]